MKSCVTSVFALSPLFFSARMNITSRHSPLEGVSHDFEMIVKSTVLGGGDLPMLEFTCSTCGTIWGARGPINPPCQLLLLIRQVWDQGLRVILSDRTYIYIYGYIYIYIYINININIYIYIYIYMLCPSAPGLDQRCEQVMKVLHRCAQRPGAVDARPKEYRFPDSSVIYRSWAQRFRACNHDRFEDTLANQGLKFLRINKIWERRRVCRLLSCFYLFCRELLFAESTYTKESIKPGSQESLKNIRMNQPEVRRVQDFMQLINSAQKPTAFKSDT